MKWEAEKERGRVASLVLEEKNDLNARYKIQAENELEARRVPESNMKRYLSLTNDPRNCFTTLQAKLEFS